VDIEGRTMYFAVIRYASFHNDKDIKRGLKVVHTVRAITQFNRFVLSFMIVE